MNILINWPASDFERAFIQENWPCEARLVFSEARTPDALKPHLAGADAIFGQFTREMVEQAPRVKLLHVTGHGVDMVLETAFRELLKQRNIAVCKAQPGAVPIAEMAIMLMIALTRRTFKFHEALAGRGSRLEPLRARRMEGAIGGELFASTLGLLGFGTIGKEIAKRAAAFSMEIGALVRHPERLDTTAWPIAFTGTMETMESFLSRCDYVAVCLPNTPETDGCLNHQRFAAMKDGAYLVNVARGAHVVDAALFEALCSGKLAGAALDVWRGRGAGGYPFPYPIHQFNVIMTPHYAGSTREARLRALTTMGENLRRFIVGEPLLNQADLDDGY